MAKFCGNCGAQMDDSARVCGNCGMAFSLSGHADVPGDFKAPKESKMTPEKKSKIKKTVTFTTVVALLVIFIIIVLNIISNFTGYKGTLRKAIKAVNDYDVETILDVSSEIKYVSTYESAYDIEEAILDEVSDELDDFEVIVGHDPKISYKIKDSYKFSDRKLQDFISELSKKYSYDGYSIEDVVQMDLEIEVTGSNKYSDTDYVTVYMIKEDGKWYVFDGLI